MTLTADSVADAAYIETGLRARDRSVAESVPIRTGDGRLLGALDLDADGVVLGVEILGANRRLAGLLESGRAGDGQ